MNAMTRPAMSVSEPTLYVAFELGTKDWKLAMTSGFGVQPWVRTMPSRDWAAVARVLAQGRARFRLPGTARVESCYEAGRDGFWIHRALLAQGIANRVVDSASIEVNRRARRAGAWWTTVRDWAGAPLPAPVQARLARADVRLAALATQIAEIEAQQQAAVSDSAPAAAVRHLVQLKGVAPTSASVLLDEGLLWRAFRNRRQIGGLLGFAPTPYNSGDSTREQGISRAGNARLQAISIQLAWNWVRWQPQSALTKWYATNFGQGKRARRIGIVALARKLVIALWRYVTSGVIPAGAIMKTA